METDGWDPRCMWPTGLVPPVVRDPSGQRGPTRGQAQRGRWRRVARAHYVPVDAPRCVEQRIVEEAVRLDGRGAVTGWASLRAHGAAYFEGCAGDSDAPLPVPLISPRQLSDTTASCSSRASLPEDEVVIVHGIRCTRVERALSDEIERIGEIREAVVAIDMACAARVTSLRRLRIYAHARLRGARRDHLLSAVSLADENSRSPQETRMRLVWMLDAQLPRPVCNPIVYTLSGDVIGSPDILDPASGVAGEYDGAVHRSRSRHRRDVERGERFRRQDIETFTIVGGDSTQTQVERMRAAHARSVQNGERPRTWTLTPPPGAWVPATIPLDQELDARHPWPPQFE